MPVEPIIRMFFGAISSATAGGSFSRRSRLRNAIATARLARPWPMMKRSSSATMARGVRSRPAGPGTTSPAM